MECLFIQAIHSLTGAVASCKGLADHIDQSRAGMVACTPKDGIKVYRIADSPSADTECFRNCSVIGAAEIN